MVPATLSPYAMLPTFEDLHSRLRREVARLRVKGAYLAIAGAHTRLLADVQANLLTLCADFAAWRDQHLEVMP